MGGQASLVCDSVSGCRAAALETIAALKLLAPRIKPSDDLDFEALLTHFENTVQHVPQTDDALASLAVKLLADKQRRIDNANPWDLLAVDFSIFHPQARTVLDDPFFWKGDDDFAPHGNDTGADLLVAYRKWLKKNKDKNPLAFYYALPPQWGFGNAPKNETEATVFDQAAVALAFAELKLRGCCGTIVTELANAALLRQRVEAEAASGWQHQDERLKKLSLLANTLNAARAP